MTDEAHPRISSRRYKTRACHPVASGAFSFASSSSVAAAAAASASLLVHLVSRTRRPSNANATDLARAGRASAAVQTAARTSEFLAPGPYTRHLNDAFDSWLCGPESRDCPTPLPHVAWASSDPSDTA
ncbi:hypothetical protein BD309DRAFT_357260 [Dichomitus squalens]|nr:hypothetical protein BD309DRAFT_357260 [Dichomitus squalens]